MQGEGPGLTLVPEQLRSVVQCLESECKVLLRQANASAKDRQLLMQVSTDAAPQMTEDWSPAAQQTLHLVDRLHQKMQALGQHHAATVQAADSTYIDGLQECQSELEELNSQHSSADSSADGVQQKC